MTAISEPVEVKKPPGTSAFAFGYGATSQGRQENEVFWSLEVCIQILAGARTRADWVPNRTLCERPG